MTQIPLLPPEASTSALQSDRVFLALLALALFFIAVIAFLILYFGIRYRRRSPDEVGKAPHASTTIEWVGMGGLMVLALGMYFWAGGIYADIFRPPPNALPIYVTGKQWMWKVQQPTGQREINTMHVPAGQPIKLVMTSEDVIHDFYVPAFRIKADVLPGRYATLWFQPTQPGTYHLFCSQYCGVAHSLMVGDVIVMSPADYQTWLQGGPQQSPAQIGAGLFQQLGCNACHVPGSAARAPNLAGLFGSQVHLNNGQTVVADENYIRESILSPSAKIVAGYQPIMPSFQGRVSEDQLFDLIAYIQSLGSQGPSGAPPAAVTGQPAPAGVATAAPGGTPVPGGPAAPTPAAPAGGTAPSAADVAAGSALFTAN
ncbi:MAG TPA: cytochrome c oxidase subunit II, partial [Anaerolineae bacterium]